MEACATSHFWARRLIGRGFEVILLPPHYVRPYVRRNKTDRTDCEALLEALRCSGIHPVAVKSEDQQAVAALHRVRSQWMATRTARINAARALLREFGITCALGAERFLRELLQLLDEQQNPVPPHVRHVTLALWEEVQALEARVAAVEVELKRLCTEQPALKALLEIPGVGVLTATALWASVGNIHGFKSGRHLASWLGLTPREHSSGGKHRLGRISKQGDAYLRMLLIHGARSALVTAGQRARAGKPLSQLQQWAVKKSQEQHFNTAAVALANKMARVIWAVWKHERSFDGNHLPQAA